MTAKGKFSEAGQKLENLKRALDKLNAHQKVAPATVARFFPEALKTMKSAAASDSSDRRASNRPKVRFRSIKIHTDFNFHK
jgi:hypothetical protein